MLFHHQSKKEVLEHFNTDEAMGLSSESAVALKEKYGDNKLKENEAAIKQLRQEQDTLVKEDCTQEISDVQQNNTQLQQQIDTLKTECDQLDENNVALQQEYETLSQDENTIYYLTVLESLKKGMEKVESYINNAQ